jgi:hypothetical protein
LRRDSASCPVSRKLANLTHLAGGHGTSPNLSTGTYASPGWLDQDFTDPRLCAAIVDRLTFGGTIIETGTQSYRLAQTRAARQG